MNPNVSCWRALMDSHPLSPFLSLDQIQSPKPSFLKALYNVLTKLLFSLNSSPLSTAPLLLVILWPLHVPRPLFCTMFFLSRLILLPSSSDEIPYPPKSSVNVTEFVKHSADLILISPFSLPGSHSTPYTCLNYYLSPQNHGYVYCELFTNKSQVSCIFVAPESSQ